jgi:hypothetical protein
MKIKKEELPVKMEAPGAAMRVLNGYGGMAVAFNEFPAGTDIGPLLEGLKNNSCHCPHWGYLLAGELLIKYDNGTEETITAGDVFYMPPGHTAIVKKDMKIIDFSPEKEFNEVIDHIAKKMAAVSN